MQTHPYKQPDNPMTDPQDNHSRRDFLTLTGTALTTTTLAGCTSTDNSTDTPTPAPETNTDTPIETTETDDNTYNETTKETARDVAATVRESTVQVGTGNGGGTGWVLDTDNAYIVTNSHVVRNTTDVQITTYDDTTYSGTVIGNVDGHIPDVALIQINNTDTFDLPALSLGDDTTLEHGDELVQVGHPMRVGGWVSSLGEYQQHEDAAGWFESSLPSQPGNSGSPVVTLDGNVVGMTSGSTSADTAERPHKHTENPPKLYTEYPEPEEVSTHVPITTIEEKVENWTN